jgi:hypothetical protein
MFTLIKRHDDDLALRNPTETSFARSLGFSKEDDSRLFQILEEDFETDRPLHTSELTVRHCCSKR